MTPVDVSQIGTGHNPTFLMTLAEPRRAAVLKTYGHAGAAKRKQNESEAIKLLRSSPVGPRVPGILAESSDGDGTPWILMEWRSGRDLADAICDLSGDQRAILVADVGRLCRQIHDLRASGFGPLSDVPSRAGSWRDYFLGHCDEMVHTIGARGLLSGRRLAKVRDYLLKEGEAILIDPVAPAVLHNDYHFWNMQVSEDDPLRVSAILDFELTAGGDPRLDFAWLEHIHDRYLSVSIEWSDFYDGYGATQRLLSGSVRTLYSVYKELFVVYFFLDHPDEKRFHRHLDTLRSMTSRL